MRFGKSFGHQRNKNLLADFQICVFQPGIAVSNELQRCLLALLLELIVVRLDDRQQVVAALNDVIDTLLVGRRGFGRLPRLLR